MMSRRALMDKPIRRMRKPPILDFRLGHQSKTTAGRGPAKNIKLAGVLLLSFPGKERSTFMIRGVSTTPQKKRRGYPLTG